MDTGPVKPCAILLLSLFVTFAAPGQQKQSPPGDDLTQSIEAWMRENLDDSVLEALQEVDQERVRKFFGEVQKRFGASSIYDLGSLQDAASQFIPLLQQFDETRPYAVWLQTHFDYFDTANELRRQMTPPEKPKGIPAAPSLKIQRSVWSTQLKTRPLPPPAAATAPQLKKIFTSEGVPAELVWIAEVESSFDPKARSPAGAAGLFQLMPVTARNLGLSSWPRDERLHPEKSARAAAKYLRRLHTRFGDWPLALAAYNAGETRVDTLLSRAKTRTFESIASRLPAETQMYVPKVEATVLKREGRSLSELRS